MILGIPNVGKSTLINMLTGRKGQGRRQPAVTKQVQQVILERGIVLSDNAGILWPERDAPSLRPPALAGALPDTAMDFESVAHAGAEILLERAPMLLAARYKLSCPLARRPRSSTRSAAGAGPSRRGEDRPPQGGRYPHPRLSGGSLGRITLEDPPGS